MENDALFETLARMGQVLGSPLRLKLVHLLSQCERSVESLAETAGEPIRSVSHHLQRLKSVQMVHSRREGRHVIYGVADSSVPSFWTRFREFAEGRMTDLRIQTASLADERASFGAVDQQAFKELLFEGRVVLLDVRPIEEYVAGHMPGAISMPLDDIQERLEEVPREETVVVYCRGPYCHLADRAVSVLQERGVRALRLSEGVVEWAAAGHPVRGAAGEATEPGAATGPAPQTSKAPAGGGK